MKKHVQEKLIALSEDYRENYLSHISVDCVVFGFHNQSLKVMLVRTDGVEKWMLPGGYVKIDENITDSTRRVLYERTGTENIFLRQFEAFGDTERSESYFDVLPDNLWQKERFVTIGYYALVDFTKLTPVADTFSDASAWYKIGNIPNMGMDHLKIFHAALTQLRRDSYYRPIGYNLLPEKFTLSELQCLYEVILDRKLNRGNFYRKIMKYNILEKLDETRKGVALSHRASTHLIRKITIRPWKMAFNIIFIGCKLV